VDSSRAEQLLKALGAKHVTVGSRWVSCRCLLAKWTHQSGRDENPSFGLSVLEGGRSKWNCFTCGSGSVEELLGTLELYYKKIPDHGLNFKAAHDVLAHENDNMVPLPAFLEFKKNDQHLFQEWPEYCVDEYPKVYTHVDAVQYLKTRDVHGVPEIQWAEFDLRWDNKDRRIIAPFRNVYAKLAGMRGRGIDPNITGWKKHFDYPWNGVRNTRLVWFNEQSLQIDGPVVVVEGQFDCMRVAQSYPKVVANLTAMPTPSKLNRLLQSSSMVLIADPDATGERSRIAYRDFCSKTNFHLDELYLPTGIDPSKAHPEYLAEALNNLGLNTVLT